MKRVFFLLIGILIMCVACQDDFVESENAVATKSSKFEKTKTHQIKGWMQIIPDEAAGRFQCETFGPPYDMCASGWEAGHVNILGKFIQEQSTYTKLYCELMMTPEGPVVYNEVSLDLLLATGERVYMLGFAWINPATGEVTGHGDYTGGTGRFEGITGTAQILNGVVLPEGGLYWDAEGFITLEIK
ncbi:hypothetical protein [Maribellus mangrovi]|uniref:hypothetical protein n=1 Tax=Maribellus mangrovi TaxID=3133146 RepID=UPI0030EE2A59